jgi:hypothetical protein
MKIIRIHINKKKNPNYLFEGKKKEVSHVAIANTK